MPVVDKALGQSKDISWVADFIEMFLECSNGLTHLVKIGITVLGGAYSADRSYVIKEFVRNVERHAK